jgi:hypothetical protein
MARQALVILAVVIVFGVLVPVYKGFGFLDPRIIAAYACLAVLFVAPASAELAAMPGKEAPVSEILGRIAIIVAWGWGLTVLILATGIVTVNVMINHDGVLRPQSEFLSAILMFSLIASIAVAMLGAAMVRRFSAHQVKTILRTGFLVILLGLAFGSRLLPESVTFAIFDRFSTRKALTHLAWEASAASGLIAVGLWLVLLKTRPADPFRP